MDSFVFAHRTSANIICVMVGWCVRRFVDFYYSMLSTILLNSTSNIVTIYHDLSFYLSPSRISNHMQAPNAANVVDSF